MLNGKIEAYILTINKLNIKTSKTTLINSTTERQIMDFLIQNVKI